MNPSRTAWAKEIEEQKKMKAAAQIVVKNCKWKLARLDEHEREFDSCLSDLRDCAKNNKNKCSDLAPLYKKMKKIRSLYASNHRLLKWIEFWSEYVIYD